MPNKAYMLNKICTSLCNDKASGNCVKRFTSIHSKETATRATTSTEATSHVVNLRGGVISFTYELIAGHCPNKEEAYAIRPYALLLAGSLSTKVITTPATTLSSVR